MLFRVSLFWNNQYDHYTYARLYEMCLKVFLFWALVAGAYASVIDDDECKITRKDLPEQKLRDHLFCDYSGYDLRPVKNHNISTNLTVKMIMKYFSYDETTATLSVDTWMALFWKDEHLKWEPKDFDGIKQIHIKNDEMWVPDLSLYNKADQSGDSAIIDEITCILDYKGSVACVPTARHEALCIPDLSKFPYDSQTCSLRFGSWIHTGEELNLLLAKPAFTMEDIQQNGNWELASISAKKSDGKYKCCPNNTFPSLEYTLVIDRISPNHASTVIIPAVVLLVMSLTSLWIPPVKQERMNLCFVNLISHFLHLQYVSWMIPTHGKTVPYLVSYARDSLLLCCFTIVLTVILKNLIEGNPKAPGWVSSVVSFLTGCKAGEIILLNDYSLKGISPLKSQEDEINIINNTNTSTENKDWLVLAKVLDRICFLIYCLIYLIMFITFLP
ncbi:neuronal acetylcholine receptor subunit alpha-3-like isoform X2 [Harmonia axyridis]|uniref:neuronal acetylcholine receptor subunit alpha-3-like isoform X2 n=1 Tax=Harmonia axyridis TaxID=115357 RepID=UPI001E274E45|nr:neuronal acetylcholine receptor subunit alpha-3-like isoform X2 [Harmonia axyridis]